MSRLFVHGFPSFPIHLERLEGASLGIVGQFCGGRDVEAALAATDALRNSVKAWLQLSHLVACETLGRLEISKSYKNVQKSLKIINDQAEIV